ncbi:MAG: hypothetical protein C0524_09660 [Rhodobacter sp.]|nr:hypothetical protein [Rhodobacter sp.]
MGLGSCGTCLCYRYHRPFGGKWNCPRHWSPGASLFEKICKILRRILGRSLNRSASSDSWQAGNRRFPAEFDCDTYKWRHLIENVFGKLKEYTGIAMRCCKTDTSYNAFIAIAATVIRLR